jgi:uncharacterized protein YdhG (YjbR/CyaY superfamily)
MKKVKTAPKSVEEYIAGVPEPARTTLSKVRAAIRAAAPADAVECISYGMPALKRNGVLIWYAAFSDHCSLFPTPSIVQEFKNELVSYKTSKGTIHFPLDMPPPSSLLKKIVKTRVRQIESKNREKDADYTEYADERGKI